MSLISHSDYPDVFTEDYPHTSTIPLYMRLKEHHCISPAEPLPCGGRNDGFDDGLFDGYFPQMTCITPQNVRPPSQGPRPLFIHAFLRQDAVLLHDQKENIYRYETCIPGKPSSHSDSTCHMCLRRAQDATTNSGPEEGDGDGEDYEDEDCNGVRDIIITGAVSLRLPFVSPDYD
jgi:hypothetical protein